MSTEEHGENRGGQPAGEKGRGGGKGRRRNNRRGKRPQEQTQTPQTANKSQKPSSRQKGRGNRKPLLENQATSTRVGTKPADAGANGAVKSKTNAKANPKAKSRGNQRRRAPLIAAIDLGTNNCRLLVAQSMPQPRSKASKSAESADGATADSSFRRTGTFRITDAFSRIVRLGEGLASSGRLSDEAMERTIGALKICANKIAKAQPVKLDAVATEACRRAENGEAFLARVKQEVGIDLRIISGDEEAELALKSCLPLLDPTAEMAVVFDIGGGSTEVSVVKIDTLKKTLETGLPVGRNRKNQPKLVLDSISAPVGVVTFAERASKAEDEAAAYAEMRAEVTGHFRALAERHDLHRLATEDKLCVIGTGGTITTLKALHLGLRSYDRSKVDATSLESGAWQQVIADIAGLPADQRGNNGCIGQGRADLVLPGCSILEGMMDLWPVAKVGVADRGLREGLLVTMMASIQSKSSRRRRGSRGKSRNRPS